MLLSTTWPGEDSTGADRVVAKPLHASPTPRRTYIHDGFRAGASIPLGARDLQQPTRWRPCPAPRQLHGPRNSES